MEEGKFVDMNNEGTSHKWDVVKPDFMTLFPVYSHFILTPTLDKSKKISKPGAVKINCCDTAGCCGCWLADENLHFFSEAKQTK